MPRSIDGHGLSSTRKPPPPFGTMFPSLSTTLAEMPGSGRVAEPGFVLVTPGSGEIMMPPVSVCHQVSTIGQRPPPMCSRYQIQASGLIGSPTDPSTRSDVRSCFCAYSGPHFMCERIAVGAVYRIVTPYRSMISHQRSLSGKSGVPSYSTDVAPLHNGP